jgi:aryl-alcohol dehydrogenase-like predicted oxidoreductase
VRSIQAGRLRVSVIGLGGWQVGTSAWGWGRDWGPAEARAICTRAAELGVTLFDTAESYGRGDSERMLGDAISKLSTRASIIVATKVSGLGLTRERVRGAARARLGIDWIDLYQVHGLDRWVPEAVKMAGMHDLLQSGEIRHVGVSNYDLGRWQEAEVALGHPVVSNQVRYSLLTRRPERDLLPHAVANDRLIIAWSPLEQGLLAGKYDSGTVPRFRRPSTELFSSENLRRAAPVIGALWEVAATHHATPAQVALAWLVHHPHVVAIPGAKSVSQLEENAAAADLVLADDEVAHLTAVADRFRPARHPREQARRVAMRARGRIQQLVGGGRGTAARWRGRS